MLKAIIIIIIILLVITLILAYGTYRMGFYWDRTKQRDPFRIDTDEYAPYNDKMISQIKANMEVPYEKVYITSFDGLKLFGKLYIFDENAPMELMVHGYHAVAERDFPFHFKHAMEKGHNILLIDQRSHGESEGHTVCFGVLERKDVLSWINFILERMGKDTKIILRGVSMGSATVMMSTSLPLPENVVGVIADCGYTSPEEIIKLVIPAMVPVPVNVIYPFVKLGAILFGHFSVTSSSAMDAMKQCKLPILFIHGEKDTFVPFYMMQKVYDACISEKKYKYPVPNSPHARATFEDYDGCAKVMDDFMAEIGL